MINVIIDLEFTGLDNSYIKDNEIIQIKLMNKDNGMVYIKNFHTDKKSDAGAFLCHRIDNNQFFPKKFSEDEFNKALNGIGIDVYKNDRSSIIFCGFGVELDKKMLKKYGVELDIFDIRERLKQSEHEEVLAKQGNSLEAAHYIVTGELKEIKNHGGREELELISDLFDKIPQLEHKPLLTVMPHGHCAGMPLNLYVEDYRRQADGYRYNNNDILADSLDHYCDLQDALSYSDLDEDDF